MNAKITGGVERNAGVVRRVVKDPRLEPHFVSGLPPAEGLYDPANEKDSCGVGFIADIKGRKSHTIVAGPRDPVQPRASRRRRRRPARRRRRRHAGADPARSSPRRRRSSASRCREPGDYAVGYVFMPRDAEGRQAIKDIYAETRRRGRPGAARLARRADRQLLARRDRCKPTEPVHRQVFIGAAEGHGREDDFERRLYILRKVISNSVYNGASRGSTGYYAVSMSCRTIVYKGMFLADQLGNYYPDLHDPDFEIGARAGAPALLDQHVPDLAAGASLPDGLPQRRDQHAARQRQLDGGAPGVGRSPNCSATTSRSCGRSPTRASRTPPASTTRSNSWCRAATRSPTP